MFCTNCGRKLEEGEVCPCRESEQSASDFSNGEEQKNCTEAMADSVQLSDNNIEDSGQKKDSLDQQFAENESDTDDLLGKANRTAEVEQPETSDDRTAPFQDNVVPSASYMNTTHLNWQTAQPKRPSLFARFGSVLIHYIPQPIRAIRQAGEFGDMGVGILCCLLQAVFITCGICLYLVSQVQVGYRLGFFEQSIPFGQYLVHSGHSLPLLFCQILGSVLLADVLLMFLFVLFSGGIVRHEGISKMLGGIGTSLLMSGCVGLIVAIAGILIPGAATGLAFGGAALSIIALWTGAQAGSDLSPSKLFYLLPLTLLVWGAAMMWFVSRISMLSWIMGLLS